MFTLASKRFFKHFQNKVHATESVVRLTQQEEISVGGTAIIHRLIYSNGWVEIAKILLPKYQAQLPYETFQEKEFDLLKTLYHPFIVRPLRLELRQTVGMGSKTRTLILEHIEGVTLSSLIDFVQTLANVQRRFWAYELLNQLSSAVGYMHDQGIIHGDLAPENIMIQPTGFIKLIDFGVARYETDASHSFQVTGRTYYRAPELHAQGTTSKEGDVYAIGKIFEQGLPENEILTSEESKNLLRQLVDERKLPPPHFQHASWFTGLQPLPCLSSLVQKGKLRQNTKILDGHGWCMRHRMVGLTGILIAILPLITTWLPQVAKLTVNTLPYSLVSISNLNSGIRYETPIRRLDVPAGRVQIEFVIPSQNNRHITKVVQTSPGEHVKVFEDFRFTDSLLE